jgi:hypothetical protein
VKPNTPPETIASGRGQAPILALAAILIAFVAAASGCGLLHWKSGAYVKASAAPTPSDSAAPAPAQAKIHVSYARPDDFITSLVVTKYYGADTLLTTPGKTGASSIIRFAGGIVVWQFGADKGLLSGVPVIGAHEDRPYQVSEVEYSVVPKGFTQQMPESGPPEPLEPDHFYVFAVIRASGSTSYEAVKVNGDGTLEAYAADPRAGTSYRLCCDVAADFTITQPAVSTDQMPVSSDSQPAGGAP